MNAKRLLDLALCLILMLLVLAGCQSHEPPTGIEPGDALHVLGLSDDLTLLFEQTGGFLGGIMTVSQRDGTLQGPIGDDFTVPAGEMWKVTHVALLGYPVDWDESEWPGAVEPLSGFTLSLLQRDGSGTGYDLLRSVPDLSATVESVTIPYALSPEWTVDAIRYLVEIPGGGIALTEGTYWLAVLNEGFTWAGTGWVEGGIATRFNADWGVRYILDQTIGLTPPWNMMFSLYTVEPAYHATGLYQPIGVLNSIFVPDGTAPLPGPDTIWNTAKSGSTVPLKFNLYQYDGGPEITSPSNISFGQTAVSCPSSSVGDDDVDFTTSGSTSLRYDTTEGLFVQNWKTPKVSRDTCYLLDVRFTDDSALYAFMRLRR